LERKIIINADGFGFTKGINKGIIESIEKGVVSSISCNVNFPFIKDIDYILKNHPEISIGLHFNISVGKPVSERNKVSSLVGASGEFINEKLDKNLILCKIDLSELLYELESQILILKDLGVRITHLDSHQHKHLLPGYFKAVLKLGEKYNIKRIRCNKKYLIFNKTENREYLLFKYYLSHPERILTHSFTRLRMFEAKKRGFIMADRLIAPGYIDSSKYLLSTWINLINNLPQGINEIYCHPGYPDDDLRKYAKYVDERIIEIDVITNPLLKQYLKEKEIQIISFSQLDNGTT
jgi:chitin disaccharide deacetylase